jgi:hypothetical protein
MSPTSIIDSAKQKDKQQLLVATFFHSAADTWSKQLIFLAIPVNTALYGTESWTLNVELCQQISSFYHTTIRQIIRINRPIMDAISGIKMTMHQKDCFLICDPRFPTNLLIWF